MKTTDYNGWTNRNTWLMNLHFGEIIREEIQEDAATTSEMIENFISDLLNEDIANVPMFISDFIDMSEINWGEIWEHHCMAVFYENEAND